MDVSCYPKGMEIFFAATIFTVMIVSLETALQQRRTLLCQQEIRITKRSARKR
jgi:hypothetical protein